MTKKHHRLYGFTKYIILGVLILAGLLSTSQRPTASKPFPPGTYSQEELSRNEFQYIEDGLGLPSGVLQALMMAETQDFPDNRNTVESAAGAKGAFQLMPFLSEAYGVDPTNRHEAAMAAGQELRWQLRSHDGNLDKALASYNFGHGRFRTEAAGDLSRVPEETKKHRARFHEYYDEPKQTAQKPFPPGTYSGSDANMTLIHPGPKNLIR